MFKVFIRVMNAELNLLAGSRLFLKKLEFRYDRAEPSNILI